jgi:hypothetical protein
VVDADSSSFDAIVVKNLMLHPLCLVSQSLALVSFDAGIVFF